jgi:hypothetical protein
MELDDASQIMYLDSIGFFEGSGQSSNSGNQIVIGSTGEVSAAYVGYHAYSANVTGMNATYSNKGS